MADATAAADESDFVDEAIRHRGGSFVLLASEIEILALGATTQNHGFAVDMTSLEGRATTTHIHSNDQTSEGLAVPSMNAFSVQYHPEAAAGPHDALLCSSVLRR